MPRPVSLTETTNTAAVITGRFAAIQWNASSGPNRLESLARDQRPEVRSSPTRAIDRRGRVEGVLEAATGASRGTASGVTIHRPRAESGSASQPETSKNLLAALGFMIRWSGSRLGAWDAGSGWVL